MPLMTLMVLGSPLIFTTCLSQLASHYDLLYCNAAVRVVSAVVYQCLACKLVGYHDQNIGEQLVCK